MNQQDANNETIITEDLSTQNADEIKGGPKRIFIGGLSVNNAPTALPDLEPSGEVKGGAPEMQTITDTSPTESVKIGHGRRRFKIRDTGA